MHNDMTQLATIARQQSAQAAEAETRLTKSIRWGVRVLQRFEDANSLRTVFSSWRYACFFMISCTILSPPHIINTHDPFSNINCSCVSLLTSV